MPQTMPAPWFYSLVCVWSVFLCAIIPKLVVQKFPNKFPAKVMKKSSMKPGDSEWPWY
uniref:ATP synthase complex subunit 8 n=1 Tax=Icichthys lockingtoni TaxID=302051 RepID=T2HU99_9SCOM|nr:ATPase subunit 8 [Icichthys lockingtoni]